MKIRIDHVVWNKNESSEKHEDMGVYEIPDDNTLLSTPGFYNAFCLSEKGLKYLNFPTHLYDCIYNVTILEDDAKAKESESDVLNTVQDLIDYLSTLDPKKYIDGQYAHIMLGEYLGNKNRPLLKSLFITKGDHYEFGPMIY